MLALEILISKILLINMEIYWNRFRHLRVTANIFQQSLILFEVLIASI